MAGRLENEEVVQMEHCYFCKGKVTAKRVRHIHEWGEKVFIFEDVQAEVC